MTLLAIIVLPLRGFDWVIIKNRVQFWEQGFRVLSMFRIQKNYWDGNNPALTIIKDMNSRPNQKRSPINLYGQYQHSNSASVLSSHWKTDPEPRRSNKIIDDKMKNQSRTPKGWQYYSDDKMKNRSQTPKGWQYYSDDKMKNRSQTPKG
jgi:hypothetical protein